MLKLGIDKGDQINLIQGGDRVTITLNQTRRSGARLIVRDAVGNGVTAWLGIGDCVHLDGYFGQPVRVELSKRRRGGAKLLFDAPQCVRIERVPTTQQHEHEPVPIGSSRVASAQTLAAIAEQAGAA
ncbi:MAG: hypothetical protein AAGI37_06840 [Planctomycetota bacterium]